MVIRATEKKEARQQVREALETRHAITNIRGGLVRKVTYERTHSGGGEQDLWGSREF